MEDLYYNYLLKSCTVKTSHVHFEGRESSVYLSSSSGTGDDVSTGTAATSPILVGWPIDSLLCSCKINRGVYQHQWITFTMTGLKLQIPSKKGSLKDTIKNSWITLLSFRSSSMRQDRWKSKIKLWPRVLLSTCCGMHCSHETFQDSESVIDNLERSTGKTHNILSLSN